MAVIRGALARDLARIVGPQNVVADDGLAAFGSDTTESMGLRGRPDAAVLPGSAGEVAAIVSHCYEHDLAIVPRGGGTGFAGGATALDGGVVLALDRLDRVRHFDPLLWRIHVEAGVATATVRRLARESGLYFPVDPGAAEQSQIGGNIATNAGGPHCFKYGVMRAWVTGLEAVLAPGELVEIGGPLRKDVAGYDLVGLLCGSEGTLGVVTAAWLRLMPAPGEARVVCAFYPSVRAGCEALEQVLGSGVAPAALEFLDGPALRATGGFPGPAPEDAGLLLIAEADGPPEEADELAEALGGGALRPDPSRLWRWREGVSHGVSAQRGGKLSEDVAVPVERLAEAIEGTVAIGERHGIPACSWGHAGDGNIHSTFMLAPGESATTAAEELFELALALGGTVSGEHGLGLLKRGQLRRQWPPAAVRAHESIKLALDPKGLLNPGKKTA